MVQSPNLICILTEDVSILLKTFDGAFWGHLLIFNFPHKEDVRYKFFQKSLTHITGRLIILEKSAVDVCATEENCRFFFKLRSRFFENVDVFTKSLFET